MKAVIFAGGLGTRLAEETQSIPKPMVCIGQEPILWHIMKMYAAHGVKEFVVCLGYKGHVIKDYFANYATRHNDFTIDFAKGEIETHGQHGEDWKVTLIDTGEETMTGGRLARVAEYVKNEKMFCLTYGDAVSDIDISAEIEFHKKHGKLATVAAVRPLARFGALHMEGNAVTRFEEKPEGSEGLINGGFFVLSPKVLDYIEGEPMWEQGPLQGLAEAGELQAFRHEGFWHCMDTLKHKQDLEKIWNSGKAPWKIWTEGKTPAGSGKLKVVKC